jgi:hypothetical protein
MADRKLAHSIRKDLAGIDRLWVRVLDDNVMVSSHNPFVFEDLKAALTAAGYVFEENGVPGTSGAYVVQKVRKA